MAWLGGGQRNEDWHDGAGHFTRNASVRRASHDQEILPSFLDSRNLLCVKGPSRFLPNIDEEY